MFNKVDFSEGHPNKVVLYSLSIAKATVNVSKMRLTKMRLNN